MGADERHPRAVPVAWRGVVVRRFRAWFVRLASLLNEQRHADVAAELDHHFDAHVEDCVRAGMTREEARRAATVKLGGIEQTKALIRDRRGVPCIDRLVQDLRYSVRVLRKNPSFTAAAVLTFALGIGDNTAIFSLIDAILLRPLRVPQADRAVRLAETYDGTPSWSVGLPRFNEWRRQSDAFEDLSAHWLEFANLTSGASPEQVAVGRVTRGFFRLFGASVAVGRTFTVQEDRPGGARVVLLSHELWRRQFAADPAILGRSITIGGEARTVVGVIAEGFDTEQFDQPPDARVPFQIDPTEPEKGPLCFVTGRLRGGMTLELARAQLQIVDARIARAPDSTDVKRSATVVPLRDAMVGDVRTPLMILLGAVGLVLLMTCANVAGLLLMRAMDRQREFAIRTAMGASRGRVARQLLTETVVLAGLGGVGGLTLGQIAIRAFVSAYPGHNDPLVVFSQLASLPRVGADASKASLDWRVALFTIATSTVAAAAGGLLPAVQAWRADVSAALKPTAGTTVRGTTARAVLVTAEIALALMLVVGSGLLIRTSMALFAVARGFDGHNVLTMRMSVKGTPFASQSGLQQLTRIGIHRLDTLPGIAAASAACCVPLEAVWQAPFIVAGRPLTGRWHAFAGWTFVSSGYFRVFKIPVLRGRAFTDDDAMGAPGVVIINDTMARRYWPNGDPLGERVLIGRGLQPDFERDPVRHIVGIVGDVRDQALNRPARPAMYVPVAQLPDGVAGFFLQQLPLTWIVRGHSDLHPLSTDIRRELEGASHGLPVTRVRAMDDVLANSVARVRLSTRLMTAFAFAALTLAATGIFGVLAVSVRHRTREIGIRMALGASHRAIRAAVVARGARLAGVGLVIGVALALGLSQVLSGVLFGVTPHDRAVFIVSPIVLFLTAFAASWFPAHRATLIDPPGYAQT